jgi:uncharacterized protein
MDCPACAGVSLVMSERSGVEIDYCPKCRGVWLDRGELDKIIEKSAAAMPAAVQPQEVYRATAAAQLHHYQKPSQHAHDDRDYYKKKRGGFLGELFDFD